MYSGNQSIGQEFLKSPNGQLPLDGPDRTVDRTLTLSPTKSGRVRSGLRLVRGLCLIVDMSVQSQHVRILSVGLVGSRQSLWGRVVEFGNDMARPTMSFSTMDSNSSNTSMSIRIY